MDKVRQVRAAIDAAGLAVDVEVDGGIDVATAPVAAEAGANVFVAGSAIFGHDKPVGRRRGDPGVGAHTVGVALTDLPARFDTKREAPNGHRG